MFEYFETASRKEREEIATKLDAPTKTASGFYLLFGLPAVVGMYARDRAAMVLCECIG